MKVKIGSRESALAVKQALIVIDAIREYDPSIECELVTMKTTGDRILDRPLDKVGGKGLFTKELDFALINGEIDIAVHSGKDLPADLPPELPIAAFSQREDPRDVLILPSDTRELSLDKPIGSSSKRRERQLRKLFNHQPIEPVRGNVNTRLKKLDSGQYSALVLAAAGVRRLGLEKRISRYFTVDEMIPASCQGIIAVQARKGADTSYLEKFHSPQSEICALAERAFIKTLDGSCSSPIGAHCELNGDSVTFRGFYVDDTGYEYNEIRTGPSSQAEKIAIELARFFCMEG